MLLAVALAVASAVPPVPIVLTVDAAPAVSRPLIDAALREAADLWRESGVALTWSMGEDPAIDPAAYAATVVRVTIDEDPGPALGGCRAIGWVSFEGTDPRPEIHLSHKNALAGLAQATNDAVRYMPKTRVDAIVAVALGRTLAHELGHYLLGSAAHGVGLMQAEWSPEELFAGPRPYFHLGAAQRRAILTVFPKAQHGQRQIRASIVETRGDWRDALTRVLDGLAA